MNEKPIFKCLKNECPSHCCGDFMGISDRLISLSGLNFSEIILTQEDKERLEKASLSKLIVKRNDGLFTIKTSKGGTCAALFDGQCSIYELRPSICKAFPLYLDLYVGLCADKSCPQSGVLKEYPEYKESLRSLIDIYSFWIEYYSKRL